MKSMVILWLGICILMTWRSYNQEFAISLLIIMIGDLEEVVVSLARAVREENNKFRGVILEIIDLLWVVNSIFGILKGHPYWSKWIDIFKKLIIDNRSHVLNHARNQSSETAVKTFLKYEIQWLNRTATYIYCFK